MIEIPPFSISYRQQRFSTKQTGRYLEMAITISAACHVMAVQLIGRYQSVTHESSCIEKI